MFFNFDLPKTLELKEVKGFITKKARFFYFAKTAVFFREAPKIFDRNMIISKLFI